MKIISCNINGFGCFKEKTFSFDGGLTQISEENGFGKSTLADFIKAMLYGLPTAKRGGKDFDDRTHYYPLGGGAFGGSLTLEAGGKIYRVERDFDRKSAAKDVLRLTDGNFSPLPIPSEGIGERLFGVDCESFVRTAYISRDGFSAAVTPSVSRKLGDIVSGDGGESGYETAIRNLTRAYKEIRADRGRDGAYYSAVDEKSRLEAEIVSLAEVDRALGEKYGRLNSIGGEIKRLSDLYDSSVRGAAVSSYFERYDGMIAEVKKKRCELTDVYSRYPFGVPSAEECAAAREEFKRAEKAENELSVLSSVNIPTDEKIAEISSRCDECKKLKEDVESAPHARRVPFGVIVAALIFGVIFFAVGAALRFLQKNLFSVSFAAGAAALLFAATASIINFRAKSRSEIKKDLLGAEAEKNLEELFSAYGVWTGDIFSSLDELKRRADLLAVRKQNALKELSSANKAVDDFKAKYLADASDFLVGVTSAERDVSRTAALSEEIRSTENAAENYRREKNLLSRPQSLTNLNEISEEIKRLRSEYALLGAEINSDEQILSAAPAAREQIARLDEKISALDKRYSLIKRTLSFITEADKRLREKYVDPVKEAFVSYASVLSPKELSSVGMGFDYKPIFEKGGSSFGEEYLSSGQRDCAELCMRLALVKNMYKDEAAFVIMDDPFCRLDETRLKNAGDILRRAAKDMQIIYFCPRADRRI